jgi:hypothetical protein
MKRCVVSWEICFEKFFFLTTCCNYTNNVRHCGASVVVFTCENLLPRIRGSMTCPVPLVATRSKTGTCPSGFNGYHCRVWEVLENEMRSISTNIVLGFKEVVNGVKTVDCNGSTKLLVTPMTIRVNMMHDLCQNASCKKINKLQWDIFSWEDCSE